MAKAEWIAQSKVKQKTIQNEVTFSGIGLFTGESVSFTLCPAKANSGILFQRVDLPNSPIIPAKIEYVKENPRTTLIDKDNASVQTIEHLLSAINALGIDNILIKVHGKEIVAADGSAKVFIELLEKAKIIDLNETRRQLCLKEPFYYSENGISMVAIPSNEFRISYTLNYPNNEFLRSQFFSIAINPDSYKQEIASSRTFILYEELQLLLEKGMIKGGSLDNAVVIQGDKVLNQDLRFKDEMVRHKILDLIGDLTLLNIDVLWHIIAIKSGHFTNAVFIRNFLKNLESN
ncbi:MAG: UDP-3-O-[3-hydroxymyristoyl] N-acetylglucosamine deacetylase [Chlamydiae bacterium]|nr:UDP-3-O-[3-hydroxymyristoyl] N-acetylglucosamine deacetylase [Chlamydiota bacterium]